LRLTAVLFAEGCAAAPVMMIPTRKTVLVSAAMAGAAASNAMMNAERHMARLIGTFRARSDVASRNDAVTE
jgi:hypothetical protein